MLASSRGVWAGSPISVAPWLRGVRANFVREVLQVNHVSLGWPTEFTRRDRLAVPVRALYSSFGGCLKLFLVSGRVVPEGEAGMVEEVEAEQVVAARSARAEFGGDASFVGGVRAEADQFACLDLVSRQFHRVEVAGIGGQRLHAQPVPLDGRAGDQVLRPVCGRAVPDRGDRLVIEMLARIGPELDQRCGVEGAIAHAEHEHRLAAIGPVGRRPRTSTSASRRIGCKTGVCPWGARMALTTGGNENLLSSWKQIHASRRLVTL